MFRNLIIQGIIIVLSKPHGFGMDCLRDIPKFLIFFFFLLFSCCNHFIKFGARGELLGVWGGGSNIYYLYVTFFNVIEWKLVN